MRVGIVEDEPLSLRRISRILEELGCDVVFRARSMEEGVRLANEEKPDALFLDIKLGDGDAFELLEKVNYNPMIVFVTAYSEYAIKAFEEGAVDYVLKPVEKNRLEKTLKRLKSRGSTLKKAMESLKDKVIVREGEDILILNADDILYLEAKGKKLKVVSNERTFEMYGSLSKFEERLDEFFRIHRSYLVNLSKVRRIRRWIGGRAVEMENGDILPISKSSWRIMKNIVEI